VRVLQALRGPQDEKVIHFRIALVAVPLIELLPSTNKRSPDALARKPARCQETA